MVTLDDVRVGDRIRVTHPNGSIREGVVAQNDGCSLADVSGWVLDFGSVEGQTYEILERAPMVEPTEYGAVVQTDEGRAIRLDGGQDSDGAVKFPWVVFFERRDTGITYDWAATAWNMLRSPRPLED